MKKEILVIKKDLVLPTRVVRLARRAPENKWGGRSFMGQGHLHPPVEPQFQPSSDMVAVQNYLLYL